MAAPGEHESGEPETAPLAADAEVPRGCCAVVSCDGVRFAVPLRVAAVSALLREAAREVLAAGEEEGPPPAAVIPLPTVAAQPLALVLEFCERFAAEPYPALELPLRSDDLAELVPGWFAAFAQQLPEEDAASVLLAANFLDVLPLSDLLCAHIAVQLKAMAAASFDARFGVAQTALTARECAAVLAENVWAAARGPDERAEEFNLPVLPLLQLPRIAPPRSEPAGQRHDAHTREGALLEDDVAALLGQQQRRRRRYQQEPERGDAAAAAPAEVAAAGDDDDDDDDDAAAVEVREENLDEAGDGRPRRRRRLQPAQHDGPPQPPRARQDVQAREARRLERALARLVPVHGTLLVATPPVAPAAAPRGWLDPSATDG
jgi:hypothetical protein